jgi:hypothetical protein
VSESIPIALVQFLAVPEDHWIADVGGRAVQPNVEGSVESR